MEALLNFNAPLDVKLLDQVVAAVYQGSVEERNMAQALLSKFKEHPQAWMRVDTILEHSQSEFTRYFALQILDDLIRQRWKILPADQREGIKNYTVGLVLKLSASPETMAAQKIVIGRLNVDIVQILKVDWPHHWKNFIPDLAKASQENESICQNTMKILALLSEEVFDFSKGQLTSSKTQELKMTMTDEFYIIFQLCQHVMEKSQNGKLLVTTLQTLLSYLSWIPIGYIFETPLVRMLIEKFLPVPQFRNLTMKCLTEVAALEIPDVNEQFVQLYVKALEHVVQKVVAPTTDMRQAYDRGKDEEQHFISDFAMFLTTFFTKHRNLLENKTLADALNAGHQYLVNLSNVSDLEVFKVCLEYWQQLAENLYNEAPIGNNSPLMLNQPVQTERRSFYAAVLSRVRSILINRMARPQEVIVVEDDNGHAVKEVLKTGEAVERYHMMRQTLVYLSHLDYEDTQNIMKEKLQCIMDGSQWSLQNLNSLCWAVGSIAESHPEEVEKRFLVQIVRDLLTLCEQKKGKDNKAIVASNIMYVVGQHPRFLRSHWRFLTTVVHKLFEFMHETHPGVQEMAVETFLKVVKKCKQRFAVVHEGERETFTVTVLNGLGSIISDLHDNEVQSFYEGVGIMISAHPPEVRVELIRKLMALPNQMWSDVMNNAKQNLNSLNDPNTQRRMASILRTNIRASKALGPAFIQQLGQIYLDLLNVCKFFSQNIAQAVAQDPTATKHSNVKNMQMVKRETLRLITVFIKGATQNEIPPIINNFLPPMLPTVLEDYRNSVPDARDREVLNLLAEIIAKCQHVTTMFDCVFEASLSMISRNFHEYPEIRESFFHFMNMVTQHCFEAYLRMGLPQLKVVIQSIVWGTKHTMRNISEILSRILSNYQEVLKVNADMANAFYQTHLLSLLEDVLVVLTDTFHKSDFRQHCEVLIQILHVAQNPSVRPLWSANTVSDPNMTNLRFFQEYTANLLVKSFPNLSHDLVGKFVTGLFELNRDFGRFQNHLRDFLVQIKEFSGGDDNARLYLAEEEAARQLKVQADLQVPGLVQPNDPRRDEAMGKLSHPIGPEF